MQQHSFQPEQLFLHVDYIYILLHEDKNYSLQYIYVIILYAILASLHASHRFLGLVCNLI
jgi:hypothetical protein